MNTQRLLTVNNVRKTSEKDIKKPMPQRRYLDYQNNWKKGLFFDVLKAFF